MGRADSGNSSNNGKSRKKSKGRMSYLRRQRQNGGGDGGGGAPRGEPRVDEFGQLYGDYEPVNYGGRGRRHGGGRNRGGGGGGGGGGSWGHGWRGRKPREPLKAGMKGFILTTSFKVNECVREAYNILNEYFDQTEEGKKELEEREKAKKEAEEKKKIEDAEAKEKESAPKEEGTSDDSKVDPVKKEETDNKGSSEGAADKQKEVMDVDEKDDGRKKDDDKEEGKAMDVDEKREGKDIDIDDELANEIKDLKSEKSVRRFQSVDTGVNNVVFISTSIDNPVEFAYQIFDDVTSKKETKSRNILRFLPVELTCFANNMDEVKPKVKDLLEKYLKTGYVSYRVVFNTRYNEKIQRDDFIITVADMVHQMNPLSFVDLNNAQFTIVVEVLKSVLCVGIVKDFTKFRKYNLLEAGLQQTPPKVAPKGEVASDTSTEGVPAGPDMEKASAEKLENGKNKGATNQPETKNTADQTDAKKEDESAGETKTAATDGQK